MITAITPGTNSPCMNRQKMRAWSVCAVAPSSVTTAMANSAGTITFLRPTDSAIMPTNGAAAATDTVTAPFVRLTCISDARKIRMKSGSSGCVQYTFKNVQAPAIITAKMAGSNDVSGRFVRATGVTIALINP